MRTDLIIAWARSGWSHATRHALDGWTPAPLQRYDRTEQH